MRNKKPGSDPGMKMLWVLGLAISLWFVLKVIAL